MIICFSGKIGAGKTTISKKFCDMIDGKYASFGEYIRYIARNRNVDFMDRTILQQIGEDEIKQGWEQFCLSLLNYSDVSNHNLEQVLVVDGVRHVECINTFKHLFVEDVVKLAFINVNDSVSALRQLARGNLVLNYDNKIHSTEKQVLKELPEIADIILDGNKDEESVFANLVEWYDTLRNRFCAN